MKFSAVCRFLFLGGLLFLLAKPTLVRPDPGAPVRWAGFIDVSRSMGVRDPQERLAETLSVLSNARDKLDGMDWHSFSNDPQLIEGDWEERLAPSGDGSNLSRLFTDVLAKEEYRGGVIFSDGRHVGPGDPVSEAASLGKPILAVGVGEKSFFKDVSVKSIQGPPFAFKNIETSISVIVGVIGYPGKKVNVKLKKDGRILSVQTVEVAGSDAEAQVTFQWVPTSLGPQNFRVEVDSFSGEFSVKNNHQNYRLDVGRDRFRVLYICGKPGPEYGFLRHQFKADPAVELVTFVILRNANNVVNAPDSELSLIPFPTQDVLIAQMSSFDLIVFEEFSYQQFGLPPIVMEAIRKKVESGGSFLMMGGESMLGSGTPYKTPSIDPMIPVEFGTSDVQTVEGNFSVIAKAPRHPILRMSADAKRNQEFWNQVPPLSEATLLPRGVKKGATVLAAFESGGKEYPLLTVWKHGKGRVGVLTSRNTWRFSMEGDGSFNGPFFYQTFWKNMALWLTRADQFESVRVGVEDPTPAANQKTKIRVWAYDEYFQPVPDAEASAYALNAKGEKTSLDLVPETKGVLVADFTPTEAGDYRVFARAFRKGKTLGSDAVSFRVGEGFFEEKNLKADWDALKNIARASGGRFVPLSEFNEKTWREFDQTISEKVGIKVHLWNAPWLLALLLTLLGVEWGWRKMRGLP